MKFEKTIKINKNNTKVILLMLCTKFYVSKNIEYFDKWQNYYLYIKVLDYINQYLWLWGGG